MIIKLSDLILEKLKNVDCPLKFKADLNVLLDARIVNNNPNMGYEDIQNKIFNRITSSYLIVNAYLEDNDNDNFINWLLNENLNFVYKSEKSLSWSFRIATLSECYIYFTPYTWYISYFGRVKEINTDDEENSYWQESRYDDTDSKLMNHFAKELLKIEKIELFDFLKESPNFFKEVTDIDIKNKLNEILKQHGNDFNFFD